MQCPWGVDFGGSLAGKTFKFNNMTKSVTQDSQYFLSYLKYY